MTWLLLRRHRARTSADSRAPAVAAHNLITSSSQIPDRRTPDMDEARERKDEEQSHPEEEMRLANRMCVGDQICNAGLQGENTLSPVHEFHHFVPIEMVQ